MERVEAPTVITTVSPRPALPASAPGQPNFGLLAAEGSWRNSWSVILAGRFSSSLYSGLLFVEAATAYAELYETDGEGRIRAPYLRQYNPLGDRTTWTHVVPGIFGSAGFTGLLLYDRAAGYGRFYNNDGQGNFLFKREYSGWRTSWTHIVTGRFVASSPYSSVFFYDAAARYGEVWATDGTGLTGNAPYQTFSTCAASPFTHVIAGDFHWTPGFISSVPTLTDLFFYDAVSGSGSMYRCADPPIPSLFTLAASSASLPVQASSVVAGNFVGLGNTDVAFYTGASGSLSFYSFVDVDDTTANLVLRETQSALRPTVDLVIPGNYWMSNPDDHWFNDGPPVSTPVQFDPDWRFGTGAFSDLLLYDRAAGLGQFYWHAPAAAPAAPLEGYITSESAHNGTLVATGSVLPGESIFFHVSSQSGPYSITIYLQGLFAGAPEQMMAQVEGLPGDPAPLLPPPNAYRDGAQWPAVATFVIPAWPTGLYLARVQATGSSSDSVDLPFVVRARSGCIAGALLVLSDTTQHSYNDWGGRNAYGYTSGSDFAGAYPSTSAFRVPFGFQLSFERPFHGGFGNILQSWEIPFIQWLARRGVAVDVCTCRDLHFEAPSPGAYRLLIFAGHQEYWTAAMRNSVEGFAKSGGNVAFFSGNVCWWQSRLSADGKQISCYKVAAFDPVSTTASHALTTVHWFDDLVQRPETALTGASWQGDDGIYYDADHRFEVKNAGSWVFAGTGLANGATFGGYSSLNNGQIDSSVCGTETDRAQTNGPNGLTSPANYTLASIYDLVYPTLEVGTMGLFSPAGGTGVVFNAATINWSLGLNRDEHSWNTIDQITRNVLAKLGPPRPAPWTSVSEGSTTPGAPITAVLTAPSQVTLFLADPGGGVYTTSGSASQGWAPWTSVSEGSSTPGAPITAVVTAPGQVTLFLADRGGGVYTTSGSASQGWAPWTSVSEGSTTPGAPITAVLTAAGQVTLFLADPGGGVYTTSGSASHGWAPWTSVSEGSSTPGAPITAVVIAPNQIALFLADPNGGVYTTSGSASVGWQPWTSVAQGRCMPGASITAIAVANGRMRLFMTDGTGSVQTTLGSAAQGWQPWVNVSEGKSVPKAPVHAVSVGQSFIALFISDPSGGVYTGGVPLS